MRVSSSTKPKEIIFQPISFNWFENINIFLFILICRLVFKMASTHEVVTNQIRENTKLVDVTKHIIEHMKKVMHSHTHISITLLKGNTSFDVYPILKHAHIFSCQK